MVSIRKHAKSNIRAKYDDIIVYNPSKKQVEELKELITNSLRLSNGEIQGDFGFDIIRKLIKDFTNIDNDEIDALSDEELDELSDLADNTLSAVFNELEAILTEVTEKIAQDTIRDLKKIVANIEQLKDIQEFAKVAQEFDKACEENNINLTLNDLMK
jgi:lipoate-protein ligase A